MTVRRPLKLDGTDFIELTDAEILTIKNRAKYVYILNPAPTLTYDGGGGGNIGTIKDTRMKGQGYVGAVGGFVSSFPGSGSTPNIAIDEVSFSRIVQTVPSISDPDDTGSCRFPVYFDGTDVRSMTLTDMYDTFINDAITDVRDEVYTISFSGSAPANYISLGNVYNDTRANTTKYAEASTDPNWYNTFYGNNEGTRNPDNLNQLTTTIDHSNSSAGPTFYHLYRNQFGDEPPSVEPIFSDSSGVIQQYSQANFDAILEELMRHTAANRNPYKIRYELGTNSSGALGSVMPDSRLNGSGSLKTFLANTDDYRGTEVPNGSPVTISNYYLRSYLE